VYAYLHDFADDAVRRHDGRSDEIAQIVLTARERREGHAGDANRRATERLGGIPIVHADE
jgi:hypothetical protein